MSGMQGLLGMLTQSTPGQFGNPLMDLGMGLLSVAGPSSQPQSIGQGLLMGQQMGQNRQRMALDNEIVRANLDKLAMEREALAAQQAQDAAFREDMGGFLAGLPEGTIPEEVRQLASILPTDEVPGLLAPWLAPPEETSLIRNARAAVDPTLPPEMREIILQDIMHDPNASDEMARQVLLSIQQLNLAQKQRDFERDSEEGRLDRGELIFNINKDLSNLFDMTERLERMAGTAVAPGVGFEESRRFIAGGVGAVKEWLGVDNETAQRYADDYDTFTKLATAGANTAAIQLFKGGTISDNRMAAIAAESNSPFITVEANLTIVADRAEFILHQAELQGIEVPNADKYQEMIDRIRGVTPPAASGGDSDAPASGRFVYDPETGDLVPR